VNMIFAIRLRNVSESSVNIIGDLLFVLFVVSAVIFP
jgi:hypothetical protein